MREQEIQSKIIKALKEKGAYVVNVITASKKGIPDLLICYQGRFIGLEVKKPKTKNNTSKLQDWNLRWIKEAGGEAHVIYKLEQLDDILNLK